LRDFELGDYEAVDAFATDLAVVSYVECPEHSRADSGVSARGESKCRRFPVSAYALAVVVHFDAERLIGTIELRVGYVLAHEWWGRGPRRATIELLSRAGRSA
jgi:hypothetical protein